MSERTGNTTPTDDRGHGGEIHQGVQNDLVLTTAQGAPVSDDQNSLRAGDRGPTLLEDFVLRDKIFHFDHERIPERVVHARGYGARGVFETLESLQDLKTQRDIAAQALKATRFNREYAVITAPSDGVVLRKLAQARETVAPGAPVLVLGSADAGYVLKASLADRDVVQLALGDACEVRFDALPGATLAAEVTRLPAAADARTGMFDVELALAATDPRLRSGLVARLALTPASAGAASLVRVPIAAILEGDRSRASVFVFDAAQQTVARRAVEVAFIDDEQVALASGLDAGAQVVTDGAAYVEEGKKVRVVD